MLVLALMGAIAFVLFWLGVYVYALYAVGRWLANRYRTRVSPWVMACVFSLAGVIIALPALSVPLDSISRYTLVFSVWLLHAQPPAVGYWGTTQVQRERDMARWKRTTDEWIGEFEDAPPPWLREIEQPDN